MTKPKIKHEDDEDFTDEYESDKACACCGGEFPNGCICYTKNKRPVWINN